MSIDREYKIRISTVADNSGARQAADSLSDIAGASGKATGAAKENTKETKHLGEAHGELKKLIRVAGEEFPLLGIAAQACFSEMTAGIAAVLLVFESVRTHIEETNKALEKMGADAAKPIGDMRESLYEARQAVAESRRELQDWHESLKNVLKAQGTMYDQAIGKLHDQTKATLDLIAAQEKAGLLPPGAAEKQQQTSANFDLNDEIRLRSQELAANKGNLGLLNRQLGPLEAAMLNEQQRAKDISKGKTIQEITAEIAQEKSKFGTEEEVAAQARLENAQRQYEFSKKYFPGTKAEEADKQALEDAQREAPRFRAKQLEDQRDALTRQKQVTDDAVHAFDRLKTKISELTSTVQAGEAAVAGLKSKQESQLQSQKSIEDFQRVANSPIGGKAIGDLNEGIGIADKFVSGKGASTTLNERNQLITLAGAIAGRPVDLGMAIRIMEAAKKNNDIFNKDAIRLTQLIADMVYNQSAFAHQSGYLQTQASDLRAEVNRIKQEMNLIQRQGPNRRNP